MPSYESSVGLSIDGMKGLFYMGALVCLIHCTQAPKGNVMRIEKNEIINCLLRFIAVCADAFSIHMYLCLRMQIQAHSVDFDEN